MTDKSLKSLFLTATSDENKTQVLLRDRKCKLQILKLMDISTHMEIQESLRILALVALKKDTYTATAKYYKTLIT
jgi:hypothetical protein